MKFDPAYITELLLDGKSREFVSIELKKRYGKMSSTRIQAEIESAQLNLAKQHSSSWDTVTGIHLARYNHVIQSAFSVSVPGILDVIEGRVSEKERYTAERHKVIALLDALDALQNIENVLRLAIAAQARQGMAVTTKSDSGPSNKLTGKLSLDEMVEVLALIDLTRGYEQPLGVSEQPSGQEGLHPDFKPEGIPESPNIDLIKTEDPANRDQEIKSPGDPKSLLQLNLKAMIAKKYNDMGYHLDPGEKQLI